MMAAMFAGTELQFPKNEHVVWLTLAIVIVAGTLAPTVTTAAPETPVFWTEVAMIEAVPPETAVTTPLLSTVAIAVADDFQVTARFVRSGPPVTVAVNVTLSPIFIAIGPGGETTTNDTLLSFGGWVTVTLSPQAVAVAAAKANAPSTKVERTTDGILPPW
ncbi:MAG TPA: hypothetical protein VGQ44_23375 [Gemmatimonadaceae bacterium]|jgi:hypothetical protein|nr:hypothetical protein [Gemmatimonadaceae bacterium]